MKLIALAMVGVLMVVTVACGGEEPTPPPPQSAPASRLLPEGMGGRQRMNQDEITELKKQFAEQASWGFVSRYGRTGRILSVRADDQTLEIATPRGTLHTRVGAATNIHRATNDGFRALTFEDLTPGTLVTVDGATGTQENSDAGDIELVPEGEGGFDITPAAGSGPRLMPVFP